LIPIAVRSSLEPSSMTGPPIRGVPSWAPDEPVRPVAGGATLPGGGANGVGPSAEALAGHTSQAGSGGSSPKMAGS
jgi:hypothetical protein